MRRVQGKVALVTAAGLGHGRASALMLAREGARVVVTDIKEREGAAVADEIVAAGGEAMFMVQDVASSQAWRRAVAATLSRFGGFDILVNNAVVVLAGNVEDTTDEQWRWLKSINLDAVFYGTREAIGAMKTRGGSIVNLSSIAGLIGDPHLGPCNASMAGAGNFTKSAALHCVKAGYRIRVNSIHPGCIWTPMIESSPGAQVDPASANEAVEALGPVGWLGEPNDIANGVLYLASDESKFVTGAELVIDGGYTAQ